MKVNRRQSTALLVSMLLGPEKAFSSDVPEVFKLLDLPDTDSNTGAINFDKLPLLKGVHSVINPVAPGPNPAPDDVIDMRDMRLNLHNYLAYHDGQYWCMWSDGPRIEDDPTQEVRFATSEDGIHWSQAQELTGKPEEPEAYISRGLWVRENEIIALVAKFRGKGAFGDPVTKKLQLIAFKFLPSTRKWTQLSSVYDNAINNFPPQKLPDGEWILTRRDSQFNVSILIGGEESIAHWKNFPLVGLLSVPGFRPDEPLLIPNIKNGEIVALFRNNGPIRKLYRSVSNDSGQSWTTPQETNFPNATSKVFALNVSRGYTAIILNANTAIGRREIHLAISQNGRTFTGMARLDIPNPTPLTDPIPRIERKLRSGVASLQYPHAIEQNGHLFIAFSRGKVQTEIFRVSLDDIESTLFKS